MRLGCPGALHACLQCSLAPCRSAAPPICLKLSVWSWSPTVYLPACRSCASQAAAARGPSLCSLAAVQAGGLSFFTTAAET